MKHTIIPNLLHSRTSIQENLQHPLPMLNYTRILLRTGGRRDIIRNLMLLRDRRHD